MSNEIHAQTETANSFPQVVHVREHTVRADVGPSVGGEDSAPSPHDYFDIALATCKTTTAHWYARRYQLPLERVEARVTRDDTEERKGKYVLRVALTLHGPLSDEQRARIHAAVAACPVHKLMTTSDVVIETAPLEPSTQG